MSNWVIGEVGVISLSAATTAGVPTDPTSVAIKVKKPDATVTTYTYGVDAGLVKSSTGEYYIHVDFDAAGKWSWRWETGTPDGAVEGSVLIKRSAVV